MGPSQADLSRNTAERTSANKTLFGFQSQHPKSSSGSEVAGEKWRDASSKKLLLAKMSVNSLDNNGGRGRVRWRLLGGSSPCWFWSLRRKKREYQLKDIGGLSHGVCAGL